MNIKHCPLTSSLIQYVDKLYPIDPNATWENQKKEVEYAYFDTTIFPKILCGDSIQELEDGTQNEITPLGQQQFSNLGLIRIGGRYHILDYSLEDDRLNFHEYSISKPHLVNIREENFKILKDLFSQIQKAIPPESDCVNLDFKFNLETSEFLGLPNEKRSQPFRIFRVDESKILELPEVLDVQSQAIQEVRVSSDEKQDSDEMKFIKVVQKPIRSINGGEILSDGEAYDLTSQPEQVCQNLSQEQIETSVKKPAIVCAIPQLTIRLNSGQSDKSGTNCPVELENGEIDDFEKMQYSPNTKLTPEQIQNDECEKQDFQNSQNSQNNSQCQPYDAQNPNFLGRPQSKNKENDLNRQLNIN